MAVRSENQIGHGACLKAAGQASAGQVPELDRAVLAGTGQELSIAIEVQV